MTIWFSYGSVQATATEMEGREGGKRHIERERDREIEEREEEEGRERKVASQRKRRVGKGREEYKDFRKRLSVKE